MSNVLTVEHLVKSFHGNPALNDVSLQVQAGSIHGLVGQNGAGKSTLINIISGTYTADSGTIAIDGTPVNITSPSQAFSLGIRVVGQELVSAANLSVSQTLILGHEHAFGRVSGAKLHAAATAAVHEALGVDMDTSRLMRSLRPSEIKLVQIAHAMIFGEAKVLILDEPTAPLSSQESEILFTTIRRLRDQGTAIIYVSHYLGEVLELADSLTVFRNGKTVASIPDASTVTSGQLVEFMVGRPVNELYPERTRVTEDAAVKIEVDHLQGDAFSDCSFSVRAGEIVGIGGIPGSGSYELVNTVFGELKPSRGTVTLSGQKLRAGSVHRSVSHGIVRVPRDRRAQGLVLDLPVQDNLTLARIGQLSPFGIINSHRLSQAAATVIKRLNIQPPDPLFHTRLLSGGNQQKVSIGGWLGSGASVLLLQDPTVGIDIGARADIYRTLKELADSGVAIVLASNDFDELAGLCHRVLILQRGRITAQFTGEACTEKALFVAATDGSHQSAGEAAAHVDSQATLPVEPPSPTQQFSKGDRQEDEVRGRNS